MIMTVVLEASKAAAAVVTGLGRCAAKWCSALTAARRLSSSGARCRLMMRTGRYASIVLALKGRYLCSYDICSQDPTGGQGSAKKLGIIGGTFEDGSLTFYAVPDPSTITAPAVERPADQPLLGTSLCPS